MPANISDELSLILEKASPTTRKILQRLMENSLNIDKSLRSEIIFNFERSISRLNMKDNSTAHINSYNDSDTGYKDKSYSDTYKDSNYSDKNYDDHYRDSGYHDSDLSIENRTTVRR